MYCFTAGVPRVLMAVSTFTMEISAVLRGGTMPPKGSADASIRRVSRVSPPAMSDHRCPVAGIGSVVGPPVGMEDVAMGEVAMGEVAMGPLGGVGGATWDGTGCAAGIGPAWALVGRL